MDLEVGTHAQLPTAATEPPNARPWEADDLFPEAPSRDTYGFVAGKKATTCTLDELVLKCSAIQIPDVGLVWTPDTPRMVPITEAPQLQAAIEGRFASAIRWNAFGVLVAPAYFAMGVFKSWAVVFVLFVLPSVRGLVLSLVQRRALRRIWASPPPWPRDAGARFGAWMGRQKASVTYGLAGAIGAVAGCQVFASDSIHAAGLVKPAVRGGALWRLLTAGLLHVHPLHLIFNVLSLLALGRAVEVLGHWSRLAVVFVASILAGSAFSVVLLPDQTSVGASGGIMGLLGFLLVFSIRHRRTLPSGYTRMLVQAVLWVAATGVVAYAFIDNAAHLGGLVAGLLLGWRMIPDGDALPAPAGPGTRAAGVASLAGLALAALACGVILIASRS